MIKKSLAADIQTEITHAQELAHHQGDWGTRAWLVCGSSLNPNSIAATARRFHLDVFTQSSTVFIYAENRAIEQYNKIIRLCDGIDYVTQDLCIKLLADEEKHRREFRGFLKEYEKD